MAVPRCKKCERPIENEVALSFNLTKIEGDDEAGVYNTRQVNGIFSGYLCMECLP